MVSACPSAVVLDKLGWNAWFEPLVISDEVQVTKPAAPPSSSTPWR